MGFDAFVLFFFPPEPPRVSRWQCLLLPVDQLCTLSGFSSPPWPFQPFWAPSFCSHNTSWLRVQRSQMTQGVGEARNTWRRLQDLKIYKWEWNLLRNKINPGQKDLAGPFGERNDQAELRVKVCKVTNGAETEERTTRCSFSKLITELERNLKGSAWPTPALLRTTHKIPLRTFSKLFWNSGSLGIMITSPQNLGNLFMVSSSAHLPVKSWEVEPNSQPLSRVYCFQSFFLCPIPSFFAAAASTLSDSVSMPKGWRGWAPSFPSFPFCSLLWPWAGILNYFIL